MALRSVSLPVKWGYASLVDLKRGPDDRRQPCERPILELSGFEHVTNRIGVRERIDGSTSLR